MNLSIVCAAIMQRLAVDDVVRQFRDELRRKRVERFGIFAVREPITLQRAGNAGQINARLNGCKLSSRRC